MYLLLNPLNVKISDLGDLDLALVLGQRTNDLSASAYS